MIRKSREREIAEACKRRGFEIERLEVRGTNHVRAILRRGERRLMASFASSPSDFRSDMNALSTAQLRELDVA